jgi:hypothetical protein
MGRKKKLEPLTEMQQQISDLLYNQLGHIYCDNCRFASEISETKSKKEFGYWGCEDCYRKYMGWEISRDECDSLARKIGEIK